MDKRFFDDEKFVLDIIFNFINEAIVIIDSEGIVRHLSRAYCEFLGISKEDAIGKHVTSIIENTRMHTVVETGIDEVGEVQIINKAPVIVSRIPIFKSGEIIGAFGRVLYKDIGELKTMYGKINTLKNERDFYRKKYLTMHRPKYTIDNLIGDSPAMIDLKEDITKISKRDSNVIISGESGTGKELFAHAIHSSSQRASEPFIAINCGSIPRELMESELFGYDEGAFTGASKGGKIGLLEVANKGTVFFDEIEALPMHMQVKLLRVLQEMEIQHVGGHKKIPIDIRIIAATNQSLEKMVEEKTFREDLYYRLDVVEFNIPPLRERKTDIPLLTAHIIDKLNENKSVKIRKVSNRAMEYIMKYDWPGNVRELENILERASNYIDEEPIIRTKHLPHKITGESGDSSMLPLKEIMDNVEREFIVERLLKYNGNKKETAQALGISRTSLYEKMDKYRIEYRW